MSLVHFLADFDYSPETDPFVITAYKAGMTVEVEEDCARRATALGRCLPVPEHDGEAEFRPVEPLHKADAPGAAPEGS